MPTGAPDWQSRVWATEVTTRPNMLIPTGKVYFYDPFDNTGLNWDTDLFGGGTVTLQTAYKFGGEAAVKLSTTAVAGDYAGIIKRIGLPQSEKVGIEGRFTFPVSTNASLSIHLQYDNGTTLYDPGIRWSETVKAWQLFNSIRGYTTIMTPSQDLYRSPFNWNGFKFSVDFSKLKYERVWANNQTANISSESIPGTASTGNPRLEILIRLHTPAAQALDVYIDSIVVTEE